MIDQHDALLDAIARGDPASASAVLHEHLRSPARALGLAPIDEVHTRLSCPPRGQPRYVESSAASIKRLAGGVDSSRNGQRMG